ncbi:MAG TPA: carboxypeptidase-like regulatory domain-containing protein, partial [Candidatus Saccharimonadales bacterium]|nr:carboxypeptidase-like regulatory domain-containing protein [Candidatus Saccharimonadales bacterium]
MKKDSQNQDAKPKSPAPEQPAENEPDPKEQPEVIEISDEEEKDGKTSDTKRFAFLSRKRIAVPLAVLALLIILAAVPWSRYKAAAIVLKKDVSIKVTDSTAGTPVSGALVTSDGVKGTTDASGVAKLRLPVGSHTFSVTKKYYANAQASALVPINGQKSVGVRMTATGRQVGVTVRDLLSGKVLNDVDISVAGVSAKTDSSGKALLVVPAGAQEEQAALNLDGYNDAKATIKVSNQTINQNDVTLTPAGKIYFLSKRTGKLNVMKANLDGSDPQV